MPRWCEACQCLLPLSGRLASSRLDYSDTSTGVLDRSHWLAVRHVIAGQLVGHDHSRHIPPTFEQLAEELLGCLRVSAGLDQHIEHVAVLIDRPPQVMLGAVDLMNTSSRCHVSPSVGVVGAVGSRRPTRHLAHHRRIVSKLTIATRSSISSAT